jgi:biopolymer transport protein ExbD
MRLPKSHRTTGLGFNITPMIDVVFLLIIFFLVSSHLARHEVQLELNLPDAASSQRQTDESKPRVTVNLLPDGEIQLAGAVIDAEELSRRLSFELSRSGAELEVRIRGDRQVPYRVVEPVLLACARAGAWNVTFAVTPREEARP